MNSSGANAKQLLYENEFSFPIAPRAICTRGITIKEISETIDSLPESVSVEVRSLDEYDSAICPKGQKTRKHRASQYVENKKRCVKIRTV